MFMDEFSRFLDFLSDDSQFFRFLVSVLKNRQSPLRFETPYLVTLKPESLSIAYNLFEDEIHDACVVVTDDTPAHLQTRLFESGMETVKLLPVGERQLIRSGTNQSFQVKIVRYKPVGEEEYGGIRFENGKMTLVGNAASYFLEVFLTSRRARDMQKQLGPVEYEAYAEEVTISTPWMFKVIMHVLYPQSLILTSMNFFVPNLPGIFQRPMGWKLRQLRFNFDAYVQIFKDSLKDVRRCEYDS